jgi:hypothetical protein
LPLQGSKGKGNKASSKAQKPKKRVPGSKGSSNSISDMDSYLDLPTYSSSGSPSLSAAQAMALMVETGRGQRYVSLVSSPSFSRTGWTKGLSQQLLHEYLVDCFRLSFYQDVYPLRALLHPMEAFIEYMGKIMALDHEDGVHFFLAFSKLAVQRGVLPASRPDWSWDTYLGYAAQQLPHSFDIEVAVKKWGVQEVPPSRLADGEAPLRLTITSVYGCDLLTGVGETCPEDEQVQQQVYPEEDLSLSELFEQHPAVFEEVGGVQRWQRLAADMPKWPVLGLEVEANMPPGAAQQQTDEQRAFRSRLLG